MNDEEKNNNVIKLRELQGDIDYTTKAIYNIQEDVRLILNVRHPELRSALSLLNSSVNSLSNTVKSIDEVNKKRLERVDNKLTEIKNDTRNVLWAISIINLATFIVGLILR